MAQSTDPARVHCYTNPSFCRQSEYIPGDQDAELPPPPQFQGDDLPLPPPPPSPTIQQLQYGQSNPGFNVQSEPITVPSLTPGRYGYLQEQIKPPLEVLHRRYASLPVDEPQVAYTHNSRYEYIEDEQRPQLQRHGSSRYAFVPQQQVRSPGRSAPPVNQDDRRVHLQNNGQNGRYAAIPCDQDGQSVQLAGREHSWTVSGRNVLNVPQHINTPQGRYARVPLQEEEPPALPERNAGLSVSPRNNHATQKLHEILTTPRKPRSRSEERTLSPKRQQALNQTGTPQRRALTPGSSPSGRTLSPTQRGTPQGTPQNRAFSPNRPQTSTPNKEPSARRCLPLSETSGRQQDICPASNCGRLRYVGTAPVDLTQMGSPCEPPPRYAYLDNPPESMPMMAGSPKYQVVPMDAHKRNGYQSVESAFIARTAVVPPLSPPNSDVNTTLASGPEKQERRNAPLLLVLVGILTCGLALYLSWTQGRRFYFDSAAGCGACCALAGACRSLRRTWTGLGLAGLAALSCGGLLLLAAKTPRAGTPLHDVTAGALCGVSLLGAALALLALIAPKCNCGRHRRVHSWIPHFSP